MSIDISSGITLRKKKGLKTDYKADKIRKDVQSGGEALGKRVTVVGGGASGLVAAIAAARQGAEVTIIEHKSCVGKKLLSTGNGRCNLTNLSLTKECYHCSQQGFPMKVLNRFGVEDTLAFFGELGLMTKSRNGYVYPNSEQAAAVLDLLNLELERRHIRVLLNCEIEQPLQKVRGRFLARTSQIPGSPGYRFRRKRVSIGPEFRPPDLSPSASAGTASLFREIL